MSRIKACALIINSVLVALVPLMSASSEPQIYLKQILELDFEPQQAFMLVDSGRGLVMRAPVVILPINGSAETPASALTKWLIGTRLPNPTSGAQIVYSSIAGSRSGDRAFATPEVLSIGTQDEQPPVNELRELLLRRKQTLQSWDVQIAAQEQSLRRLRADAEVIANIDHIIEIQDEITKIKMDSKQLNQDVSALDSLLKSAKSQPDPPALPRRELQLNQQITELAAIASAAEGGKFTRRANSEVELQEQLALIEATRDIDLGQLRREYEALSIQFDQLTKHRE